MSLQVKVNTRHLVYAGISAGLFVLFLGLRIPIWFLFLVLAIYYGYKAVTKERVLVSGVAPTSLSYGQLGTYAVHGDPSDQSYGIYIQLNGKPVFVDVREDDHLQERKKRALMLHENVSALDESLKRFVATNPEFQRRELKSIGLHSEDLERGEVFWGPDGYSLLKGFQFVS